MAVTSNSQLGGERDLAGREMNVIGIIIANPAITKWTSFKLNASLGKRAFTHVLGGITEGGADWARGGAGEFASDSYLNRKDGL